MRTIAATFVLVLASGTALFVIPQQATAQRIFFDSCSKVWSHRTLGGGAPENSIDGLVDVIRRGAGGVEIDIYYDQGSDKLYVQSEEFRDQGVPLTLSLPNLLSAIPPNALIWLDFWNLNKLPAVDAQKAIARLNKDVTGANFRDKVIVESKSATYLGQLRAANFYTSLWIELGKAATSPTEHPRYLARVMAARQKYDLAGASAISLDHLEYNKTVSTMFYDVPIHVFTINNEEEILKAIRDEHVKIILSDEPLYNETACK